jgi:Uroporphyrinogen decarboxylase (URO-D)
MTWREQALAVLAGKTPDVVPWFGDLDYWAGSLMARGLRPKGFPRSADYIRWHESLGVGFYLQGYSPFDCTYQSCEVREWREGELRYRSVETPRGKLRECWRYVPVSFSEAPVERLLKSEEDMPAYAFMMENARYAPNYDPARERAAQVGGAGLTLAYLTRSPLMQMVAVDAGIETVAVLAMTAQSGFDELFEILRESSDRACEISLGAPVDVLMIPENLSSEVVGKTFFERYLRAFQERWNARIRARGVHSCIHMDGTLRGLLREEASVGLSFIEGMTPSPVGDLPVDEWKAFAGSSSTVFWGGIPGSYFSSVVSDDEFERHVRHVLSVMRREPRYVLGIADQAPPDTLESRVRRVRDLVDAYGRY